jgi:AraC family transcriptional regulator
MSAAPDTYRDWYQQGPFAHVPQVDRTIPAGPVHVINVSPPAGDVVEPPMREYGLHLLLRTAPLLRVGFNRRPRWLAVSPGSLILQPPDTEAEYVAEAAAHVLSVAIPKAQVEQFAEASGGLRVDVRFEEAFRDPRLAQLLIQLWHALADEAPAGAALLADDAMRTMLDTIARRAHSGSGRGSGRGGDGGTLAASAHGRERLANHTLRRLCDYVENSLGDEIDVPMLATVASLSPAHFARAFAATVGMTPFNYVMTRRLARARELLQDTRRPALDIALDVGFKTPSHFTTRFRREFGLTPRDVRGDAMRSFAIMSPPSAP